MMNDSFQRQDKMTTQQAKVIANIKARKASYEEQTSEVRGCNLQAGMRLAFTGIIRSIDNGVATTESGYSFEFSASDTFCVML